MKKFINSFAEDKFYSDMEEKMKVLESKLEEFREHEKGLLASNKFLAERLLLAKNALELTECDCGFFIDGTPAQCIRCKALEKIKE